MKSGQVYLRVAASWVWLWVKSPWAIFHNSLTGNTDRKYVATNANLLEIAISVSQNCVAGPLKFPNDQLSGLKLIWII